MRTVKAHITVQGKPLCEFAGGHLMSSATPCGHLSLASAQRAKLEIQKQVHTVRVVRGACPA
jgi:hypothetical protein